MWSIFHILSAILCVFLSLLIFFPLGNRSFSKKVFLATSSSIENVHSVFRALSFKNGIFEIYDGSAEHISQMTQLAKIFSVPIHPCAEDNSIFKDSSLCVSNTPPHTPLHAEEMTTLRLPNNSSIDLSWPI